MDVHNYRQGIIDGDTPRIHPNARHHQPLIFSPGTLSGLFLSNNPEQRR